MKEIEGKVKFLAIGIPSETTWYKIENNNLPKVISNTLALGYLFFRFGGKNSEFYNQEKFYSLSKYRTATIVGKLSEITEKQAAEFVRMLNSGYADYSHPVYARADYTNEWTYNTAKESLISLLKTNDVWIKEWCKKESFVYEHQMASKGSGALAALKTKENAPDDLLLIKIS